MNRNVTRLLKSFIVIMTMLFDLRTIALTSSAAQEAVRTSPKGKAVPGAVELTKEEASNGALLSPYAACKGHMLVTDSDSKKPYWQERSKKCNEKTSNCQLRVHKIPDGNMFGSFEGQVGVNMDSALTATAFLEGVRKRAVEEVTIEISAREKLMKDCKEAVVSEECNGEKPPPSCSAVLPECKKRYDETMANLAKHEAGFRNAIALLKAPSDADLMRVVATGDVSPLINRLLRKASGPILSMINVPKMAPLSATEYASAEKELKDLVATAKAEHLAEVNETIKKRVQEGMPQFQVEQIRKNLMKDEVFRNKLRTSLQAMQDEKLKHYDLIVSEVPEMPFIGKSSPDKDLLRTAQKEVVANLVKAKTAMQTPLAPADLKSEKKLPEVIQYAALNRVIEGMLEEENRAGSVSSCAVATAVNLRLQEVQDRDRLAIVGSTFAGLALGGAFGIMRLGAMTVGGTTVGTGTSIAFASGIIGSAASIRHESVIKADLDRGANAQLVDAQKVRDQAGAVALGVALTPLDVFGAGAALTSAGVVAKNAGKAVSAVKGAARRLRSPKATETAGVADAAEQAGRVAVAGGDDVAESAGKASETVPGGPAASEGRTAAAQERAIREKKRDETKKVLGRNPTPADDRASKALADRGFLGEAGERSPDVLKRYAEVTKGMSQAARQEYVQRLEEITKLAKGEDAVRSETAAAGRSQAAKVSPPEDAAITKAKGLLALELAKVDGFAHTANLLKPGSGWGVDALSSLREVVATAATRAKPGEAMSNRFREAVKAVATRNKIKLSDDQIDQMACCASGACAAGKKADRGPASDGLSDALSDDKAEQPDPVVLVCSDRLSST